MFEINLSSTSRNFMNFIKNIMNILCCLTKLTFTNFIAEILVSMNIIALCDSWWMCIFSSNINCRSFIEKNMTSNLHENNLIETKCESTIFFNWRIRLRNFSSNFSMRLSSKIFNFSIRDHCEVFQWFDYK